MALATTPATQVGLLINNATPLPDGSVSTANIVTMAATGTTQLTGAALTSPVTIISNNTAANGVVLPVGTKGQSVTLIPALVTNAPKLYPPVGGTLNFGTVNASVAIPAQRRTSVIAIDNTGLNWVTDSLTA